MPGRARVVDEDPAYLNYEQVRQEQMAAHAAAEKKARELLLSLLNRTQKRDLVNDGAFTVKGGKTGIEYCIQVGYSQNISAEIASTTLRGLNRRPPATCDCEGCQSNKPYWRTICYHMQCGVPEYDHMVAQLLYIKYGEEEFLTGAYMS